MERDSRASAADAKRRLLVLHEAGHALDHPVHIGFPEGRYLKFVMLKSCNYLMQIRQCEQNYVLLRFNSIAERKCIKMVFTSSGTFQERGV